MTEYTKFDPANPPSPLMTGEPGSFAHFTMTTRFPVILQNVLDDHAGQYPAGIVAALQNLYDELTQDQPVRSLETTAPDGPAWAEAWRPYHGRTWLDLPWYFAEAFIYRRLVEAAGYFGTEQGRRGAEEQGGQSSSGQPSANNSEGKKWIGVDPFLPRKQAELDSEATWAVAAVALSHAPDGSAESLAALLHHCLWGNRADLSYTKVAELAGGKILVASEQANLLVDDTEAVVEYLQGGRGAEGQGGGGQRSAVGGRVDFLCDNAGTELLMDLVLVDFLLRFGWAERITMHV
ncbi:MAG: protein-glutamate O-methyltransferase family protein, partial [Anaerolineales bacterium]|nr:protein-glutamate O-methyltransferase family protein [Anaerolineales bacterium]